MLCCVRAVLGVMALFCVCEVWRNQEERKIIETDMNKKMEEINLNYQMEMQDQKSIIKQYEIKLLELEKELKTKK